VDLLEIPALLVLKVIQVYLALLVQQVLKDQMVLPVQPELKAIRVILVL